MQTSRPGGDDHEDTSERLSCWVRHAVRVAGHGRSRLAPDHVLGAGQHSGKRTLRLPGLPLRRGPARARGRRGEAVRREAEARGRRRGSPVPALRRASHRPFLRGPAYHADRARALLALGARSDPDDGYRAVALDSRGGPRAHPSRGGVAHGQYPHRGSARGRPADYAAGGLREGGRSHAHTEHRVGGGLVRRGRGRRARRGEARGSGHGGDRHPDRHRRDGAVAGAGDEAGPPHLRSDLVHQDRSRGTLSKGRRRLAGGLRERADEAVQRARRRFRDGERGASWAAKRGDRGPSPARRVQCAELKTRYLTTSTFTRACPVLAKPRVEATRGVTSMTLLADRFIRSLTVTTALLPLARFVTRSLVP